MAGTTLFYGVLPETPDAAVALYEYGGLPVEPALGQGVINLEFPTIQAVTRGIANDYDSPRLKIQNVVTAFALIANQNLSGTSYKAIIAKQSPFFFRRDDNFRVLFACNFQITKVYSPT